MSELFEKSIRTLELPAVLEQLAAQAVSDEAKDRSRRLFPSTDYDEVCRLQDETEAARGMGSSGWRRFWPGRTGGAC